MYRTSLCVYVCFVGFCFTLFYFCFTLVDLCFTLQKKGSSACFSKYITHCIYLDLSQIYEYWLFFEAMTKGIHLLEEK